MRRTLSPYAWLVWLGLVAPDALIAATLEAHDQRAIRAAVLDYAEGWYGGDRQRMERSLHDALAKRIYTTDASGNRVLRDMDKAQLLAGNRPENAGSYANAPRRAEVAILDGFGHVATVKLTMDAWVDYLHVVRDEYGDWRILNVLWEMLPVGDQDRPAAVDA